MWLFAVLVSFLLALGAGNAFAQAGYVHAMTGTATATVGTAQRALKIGDTLESGTTVSTGDKSSAVIKFEDGQIMALTERTSFRIVDCRRRRLRACVAERTLPHASVAVQMRVMVRSPAHGPGVTSSRNASAGVASQASTALAVARPSPVIHTRSKASSGGSVRWSTRCTARRSCGWSTTAS